MWNNRHSPEYQKRWRQDSRMSGLNFENFVSLVQINLKRQDTNLRKPIPVEKRAAVALWRLATGNSFQSFAKTFTIVKSTAVIMTLKFCILRSILTILKQFC